MVKCAVCGKELNITKKNAFKEIKMHIKECKISERQLAMAIGYYLSKVMRSYE